MNRVVVLIIDETLNELIERKSRYVSFKNHSNSMSLIVIRCLFRSRHRVTDNGLGIYEGRKIMEQKFSFALPFNRNPVAEIMTFSPPFINTMFKRHLR